jgi:ferric-dicitrate binding protein FerR (iron transport regulator)
MLSDQQHDLLLDYLDGKLDTETRASFETSLANNPELQSAWQTLRELQSAGRDWEDIPVPRWSRLAGVTARGDRSRAWGLGWLSLATSMAAILLVVFQAEVLISAEGFNVSFHRGSSGLSEQALEQRLAQLEDKQTAYVAERMDMLEEKTQAMNRQLLTAALNYNREERRQDMKALAASWSRARSSDLMRVDGLWENQYDDRQALRQLYARLPTVD